MKLLKRQKGLPFLLALGVLFILSASFLAVQLWSDKYTMRGAVQALEAPVMPPAMPKIVAPPPVKKVARTQPEKTLVQAAEVKAEPEVAAVEPIPADINAAEVKIVTGAPVEKAREKDVAPAPVVEEVKQIAVPVQKAEPVANIEVKEEKQPKSSKKARKTRKTSKSVETVPTEIPAEWNWFSQPLKLSFNDGKAVIDRSEEDKSISLSSAEKIRVEPAIAAGIVVSEDEKQPVDSGVSEVVSASEADPSVEKPFMLALARMARIRQMRRQNNDPVESAAVVKAVELSPSMKAMGSMLRELCEKLDRHPETAESSISASEKTEAAEMAADKQIEVVGHNNPETAAGDSEATMVSSDTADTRGDVALKPYYSGSGSSFSARIDSMMKQGLIRAE